METFKKYWFVLVVIVVIIALYVAIKKGVLNLFGSTVSPEEKLAAQLDQLEYDPKKLSITPSEAILISQQLLAAMDRWGTDDKTIMSLLDKLNRDDLLFVIKTFGIQPYNGLGSSQAVDRYLLYSVNVNLPSWIKAEMSGQNLAHVADIFSKFNIPF